MNLSPPERGLLEVGRWLRETGYAFTAITPASHARVNARPGADQARSVADVFGWSRPFAPALLPAAVLASLERARALVAAGELVASRFRFATLGNHLFAHSAFPTLDERAVFFGPDTYRFCRFLAREVAHASCVVDVGCGSGAGAISIADRVDRLVLGDINPHAVSLARVNAHLAGVAERTEVAVGDLYAELGGGWDLVVANPPYLVDPAHRLYRDGGGPLGFELALRIVREALPRLAPGGRVLLYTGAPIVDGRDPVRAALAELGGLASYDELDPDVFGEELDTAPYADVDRIAAVGACVLQQ